MTQFNQFQMIKRRFFAMRNGIISDTLRKAGLPYRIIFGLNIPQISEIAESLPKDSNLALQLWDNRSTRESMLLAAMVFPPENVDMDTAMKLAETTPTIECMDILCHKLLSKTPIAMSIAREMSQSHISLVRYGAMRMLWKQLHAHTEEVETMAKAELATNDPLTTAPAGQIIDELKFIRNPE